MNGHFATTAAAFAADALPERDGSVEPSLRGRRVWAERRFGSAERWVAGGLRRLRGFAMTRVAVVLVALVFVAACGADGPPVRPDPKPATAATSGVELSGSAQAGAVSR